MKFICFDLEGPLSPEDNAYELMKLFPNGGQIFEVISRYDDLLTLEDKENYEPGDALALIAPFLVYHELSEDNIKALAEKAGIVKGAPELISLLCSRGWDVFCISTSYEQYARRICQRVGIGQDKIACTRFPLDQYRKTPGKDDLSLIGQMEREILTMSPADDEHIKVKLDRFFWEELPSTKAGQFMQEIKPVGGQRKVDALNMFAAQHGYSAGKAVVIGDSITDFKMLEVVDQAGGLAIAFNANEYALPYATVGLASTHLSDLEPVLVAWEEGGRGAVETLVREKEEAGGKGNKGNFHWLHGREEFSHPLEVHKRIRKLVREEAGKLG